MWGGMLAQEQLGKEEAEDDDVGSYTILKMLGLANDSK